MMEYQQAEQSLRKEVLAEHKAPDEERLADQLKAELARKSAEIEALRNQLSVTERESWLNRQTRYAALNLMEDAIHARMAEERENSARRLMEEELRQADRRKDEFLATLAHELRNPLAPIQNGLQTLRLANWNRDIVEQICTTMERQVIHMVRLVDDLMEVSRITRGSIHLRKQVLNLTSVIREVVDVYRPQIKSAGHQLSLNLPAAPFLVDADRDRMTQVISNLISNSLKYTTESGHIWISAAQDKDVVVVRIRDTGVGIPQDKLESVFDLFTQLQSTGHQGKGGLGIGLALVRSLLHMHGGTIEARSEGVGHGTEMILTLPVVAAHEELESDLAGKPRESFSIAGSIIVVDDSVDGAESLAMLLTALGAEVRVFNDGPSAIQECLVNPPAVVLCDIGMPVMDGYEVAKALRQIPACKATLLIALTGWGQEGDRRRSRDAGFDHHLVKPIDLKSLNSIFAQSRQSLLHSRDATHLN